ncbi:NAD-dependent dehydratase [Sutcliffiella cohnii]|uniref:NAD-dependent dehydratase n=1 Tax=Sutcliffiella cohnii TaxID=33932 RepID=A0A223KPS8_9BACI|nr:NAD-dependent epimerase/dehydratase family protein [Sutcliffiella cohnii]AST91510.1 NAD-dependent dehydratase [Sutcliffiella cohnii]
MKVLVIGGTRFLGRFIVEEALKQGHEVTLFNRGNNQELFPQLETIIGDRTEDLSLLDTGKWDAAIDTCGFTPRAVDEMTKMLADKIDHYTYISSISVYKDWAVNNIDESYDVQTLSDDQVNEIGYGTSEQINEHYGALKARCEQTAEQNLPNKTFSIRAGLLVGPHDYTDRFTYWVERIQKGGKVFVPGRKDRPLQWIDARDLASWIVKKVDEKVTGVYNVTGPAEMLTMENFLKACIEVTNSSSQLIWADEQFVTQKEIAPWSQLPLWIPETTPLPGQKEPWIGTFTININKALHLGLTFRPIEETVHDTLQWDLTRGSRKKTAGLTLQLEKELLEEYLNE